LSSVAFAHMERPQSLVAVDLFCGAGGLSYGLQQAGISVAAGVDIDSTCAYPFESNVEAPFLEIDIRELMADHLHRLWRRSRFRVLAGCAPCQPFSMYRRGQDTSSEEKWSLLAEFGRLVGETEPELVTMENVPRIVSARVFHEFVDLLEDCGYHVNYRSRNGVDYGLAQRRSRLVLLASRLGPLAMAPWRQRGEKPKTVRDVIGRLPSLGSGEADPRDPLHRSRRLSEINLKRIRASTPGGTWEQWPVELRAPCHRKVSGATFRNVYARMEWDEPSPTITTLAHNFGTGRFGHPEQDRGISLREAAMLQGFPRTYRFVPPRQPVHLTRVGRLIGNAVPPPLGKAVGRALIDHVAETMV
jgi:DNA (cytosine-5)-methyltransferase 1